MAFPPSAIGSDRKGSQGSGIVAGARERRMLWRGGFLCMAPVLAGLLGFTRPQVSFCVLLTTIGVGLEASIVYKMKIVDCCRKVPFILRLLAVCCFQLQACWLLAPSASWNASSSPAPSADATALAASFETAPADSFETAPAVSVATAPAASVATVPAASSATAPVASSATAPVANSADNFMSLPSPQDINTISVVLPCANETDFVMKTVRSVFEATPDGQLHEIIVVDDDSAPRISDLLDAAELQAHRARIIRHDSPQGLIRSKKDGADAATGDIIVFLDCHVKPASGWTDDFFSNIRHNPKRIIVPEITSLDPDTWEEMAGGGGRKMCLTWNADFYWCNNLPGREVPIMSGGLLALSRFWWNNTGGYDSEMMAWGGENLYQSLQTWLCGGEIMVAETSRVAHMWRDPSKPKTQLHYSIPTEHVRRNRLRAATSWMGEWAKKVRTFPEFEDFREGGPLKVGNLENVEFYRRKLQCKGFKSYLDRFRDLYLSTGLFPDQVFNLRHRKSQLCLHHELGYHSNQGGEINLRPCARNSEAQRFHAANRKPGLGEASCCSGIKLWDLDVCLGTRGMGDTLRADACFPFGEMRSQFLHLSKSGLLQFANDEACVVARGQAPSDSDHKASMFAGNGCSTRVETLATGFRVIGKASGGIQLCLSAFGPAENGQHLRFIQCKDGDEHQIFHTVQSFDANGHQQIKTSRGYCLDAANGEGPIEYPCHDAQQTADSVQQHFYAKPGENFKWRGPQEHGSPGYCIDPESHIAQLAPCAGAHDTPKAGQGFRKHDVRESDGSFQLQEPESGHCLAPFGQAQEWKLRSSVCVAGDAMRWTESQGQLQSLQVRGHCIDAGDQQTPIVYPCYPPHQNPKQHFTIHSEGWIEVPRSWADNGRVRYLAKCLDSRPLSPMTVTLEACGAGADEWEQLWPEVPLETQLWRDANRKPNLRGRT